MKKIILTLILGLLVLPCLAQEVPDFMSKGPEEGLMEALEYYEIHHKEIVYAQAILETGHFKSGGCKKGNNFHKETRILRHAKINKAGSQCHSR